MYAANIEPQAKVKGSLPLTNLKPEDEGLINGKLPMIENEGCIFVVTTIEVMLHIIYML